MMSKPRVGDMQVTFGGKVIGELQAVSYTTHIEETPIYEMSSASPVSFLRGKREFSGTMTGYLNKDILAYHYSTAEFSDVDIVMESTQGIHKKTITLKDARVVATSDFGDPQQSSMLYDMSFTCADADIKEEIINDIATNKDVEYLLQPLDDEPLEMPSSLTL